MLDKRNGSTLEKKPTSPLSDTSFNSQASTKKTAASHGHTLAVDQNRLPKSPSANDNMNGHASLKPDFTRRSHSPQGTIDRSSIKEGSRDLKVVTPAIRVDTSVMLKPLSHKPTLSSESVYDELGDPPNSHELM